MVRWDSDKIRQLREAYGEQQVVFCRRLGVTPTALRYWEWARGNPTGSALQLLDRLAEELREGRIRDLPEED